MRNFEHLSTDDMRPLVSVILPCYNTENHIAQAIGSMRQQDYPNVEIIVLDDHSSDQSWKIIQGIASEDPRILAVRNEENLRLIKTLNKGIQLARGQYIARMDADDWSDPTRIARQVAYLEQHPDVDMVATCATYISERGRSLGRLNFHGCYDALSAAFVTLFDCPFLHPSILIKGDLLRNIGYSDLPETHHIEDYALWMQLIQAGHRLEIIPERLMSYRISYQGVSQRNAKLQFSRGLDRAAQYFQDRLGYSPDISCFAILRQGADQLKSLDQLFASIHYLQETAHQYKIRFKPDEQSSRSIKDWCHERILRLLWLSVVRSKLPLSSKLHIIFLDLPKYFCRGFHVGRLKNIYFHFQFMAKRRLFKPRDIQIVGAE